MKKLTLSLAIVAIVVGGGAFFGGMKYAQSKATLRFQQFGTAGMGARGARSGNRAGAGGASGEIISKDDKNITVKLRDGGSKIIFYSDTTEISKFVSGTMSDVLIGKTVTITGQTNSDGSLTSQSIQIRPTVATSTK